MARIRITGYAIIGFFIGFILAFSIGGFANGHTDISEVSGEYVGPVWAVFWQNLSPFWSSLGLPILGATVGIAIGILYPSSLKK